jgi:polyferredoxin
MTSSFLRRFRTLFAVIIFIFCVLIFIDFRSLIPESFKNYILYFQFIPSLIKYLHLKTIAAGGFIAVLVLTLISGRTYCSFFCPLGITQDLISRLGGRIKRRFRRYGYKKPFTIIRYSLLAITLVVTIVWGLYLVILLDPYSTFGRLMTYFVKPVILLLNNFIAGILGKFDIYTLTHVVIRGFHPIAYIVPVAFLILIGIQSLIKCRLYFGARLKNIPVQGQLQ